MNDNCGSCGQSMPVPTYTDDCAPAHSAVMANTTKVEVKVMIKGEADKIFTLEHASIEISWPSFSSLKPCQHIDNVLGRVVIEIEAEPEGVTVQV